MTTSVPPAVQRLLDAAATHSTEQFLASFSPDGVVDDWGREFQGRDAIRRWSDGEFIGVRVTLDVTGVVTRGGDVVVEAQVGGDGFTGPSHFTFRVAGDRVERMTIRS